MLHKLLLVTLMLSITLCGCSINSDIEPASTEDDIQVSSNSTGDNIHDEGDSLSVPPYIPPNVKIYTPPHDEFAPKPDGPLSEMDLVIKYLRANLSDDDYSHFYGKNDTSIEIWCTNKSNVEKLIAAYGDTNIQVNYYDAKYPRSVLEPLTEEIANSDFIMEHQEQLTWIIGDEEGIEIMIQSLESFPEITEWVQNHPNSDMIRVSEYLSRDKPLPN